MGEGEKKREDRNKHGGGGWGEGEEAGGRMLCYRAEAVTVRDRAALAYIIRKLAKCVFVFCFFSYCFS